MFFAHPIVLVLTMAIAPTARAAEPTISTTAPTDAARQLREDCRDLIARAIRRPYGWAWEADLAETDPKRQRNATVATDRGESAAVGLVLLWSAELLDDPELAQAAHEVARGVVAAQAKSGMILSRPTFASNAGGREEPQYVPDRGPTVAGLALLLSVIRENEGKPLEHAAQLRAAAARATTWLRKQQSANGAWPSGFPAGAGAKESVKVQRLDDPVAIRDSTFALILAADVLQDKQSIEPARRAVELLLRERLADPPRCADLWAAAYTIDGGLPAEHLCFPDGADLLASRHAVQVLLAAHLIGGEPSAPEAIARAGKAVEALRLPDGTWERFPSPGPPKVPATQAVRPGDVTHLPIERPGQPEDYGLSALVSAASRVALVSRSKQSEELEQTLSVHRHLAASMAGLFENALLGDPQPGGISTGAEDSGELRQRINRLWQSFVAAQRASVEQSGQR